MRVAWARGVLLAAAFAAVLAGPAGRACAQNTATNQGTTSPEGEFAPRYKISPVFTNTINGSVSSVDMKNSLITAMTTPWGSNFNFEISGEEKNYRLQNRLEQTKVMRLSDLHMFSLFSQLSVVASDSRVFNRSIAVGGGVQDFIINDQMANVNSTNKRVFANMGLGDLRTDLQGTGGVIRSERTFKNDKGIQAGGNGGFAYDVGDLFTWQGRGALRRSWDQSSTVDTTITGLSSNEDSLMTGVTFVTADSLRFDATHKRYSGDRDFTDQRTGSLGSQVGGAENVFVETEMRDTRNTALSMNTHFGRRLSMTLNASHDELVFDYKEQKTRYSRTVSNGVNGNINYRLPWKTITALAFDNNESLRDLGPQSVSSATDKRKRVSLNASHQFSQTFSMDFNGASAITQTFYLKPEDNPRDRDQVDSNLNLRINSRPFQKIMANITLGYSVTDIVNIKASQSRENRTTEQWDFRPALTYYCRPNLTIIQVYGLAFEYTDYVYQAEQNYLDRNITFSNVFQYKPTKNIDTSFEYALSLHDKGSYLPDEVTGERLLNVSSEDRRDRTVIRIDYRATQHIKFFTENQYSRFETGTPGSDEVDETIEGQVVVGTTADYAWGDGRRLRLLMSRVKRFSPLGVDAEKNYWDARSEIVYSF